MRPRENQRVALAAPGWNEPEQGTLLVITGSGGHVKWDVGPRAGSITLTDLDDLAPVGHVTATVLTDAWTDSLETAEGLSVEAAMNDDEWVFGDGG